MRGFIALVVALVLSGSALAQPSASEYYSRTNPPPKDPDIDLLKARVFALEQLVAAQDSKLDTILAAVKKSPTPVNPNTPAPSPIPVVKKAEPTASARAPQGHTHTDSKGHTWDHAASPGHNCPLCGEFQNIQDSTPRMVNVGVVSSSTAPTTSAALSYSLSGSASGGCASGSCGSSGSPYSTQRVGIFRRR